MSEIGEEPGQKGTAYRATKPGELWSHTRWVLQLSSSTCPRPLFGMCVLTLILGLTPAGIALAARGLINAILALRSSPAHDSTELLLWLLLVFGLTMLGGLGHVGQKYLGQRFQDELEVRVTSEVLRHAANLDVAVFEDPRFHDVLERAQQNVAQHCSQLVARLLTSVTDIFQILSLLGVLIFIEPWIVLVLGAVVVPFLIFQWRLARIRYGMEHSCTRQRRWCRYFVKLLTDPESVAEVKLLRLAPLLCERFGKLMSRFRDESYLLQRQDLLGTALFVAASTTALFAACAWVVFKAAGGLYTVGDVVLCIGALQRLRGTSESLTLSVGSVRERLLFVANLREFFKIRPKSRKSAGVRLPHSRGELELRNVSFTYPGGTEPVLEKISFDVRAGETIALVGANGAGKTTLVKLIAGLHETDEGAILLDGLDLGKLPRDYVWDQIAFVFQAFNRYEATALENIAYGDWQDLLEHRDHVVERARGAKVHKIIEAMPEGYDTPLGKKFGHYDPSNGQWQQLAIARAFARMHKASIVVLDEPTASLDACAEYEFFKSFRELSEGKTRILISHRFSTVGLADRIIVLNQRRIAEQGTHVQLLNRGGIYAALYRLHAGKFGQAPDTPGQEVAVEARHWRATAPGLRVGEGRPLP